MSSTKLHPNPPVCPPCMGFRQGCEAQAGCTVRRRPRRQAVQAHGSRLCVMRKGSPTSGGRRTGTRCVSTSQGTGPMGSGTDVPGDARTGEVTPMSVESMTSVLEGHIDQGEARDRQRTYHRPRGPQGTGREAGRPAPRQEGDAGVDSGHRPARGSGGRGRTLERQRTSAGGCRALMAARSISPWSSSFRGPMGGFQGYIASTVSTPKANQSQSTAAARTTCTGAHRWTVRRSC